MKIKVIIILAKIIRFFWLVVLQVGIIRELSIRAKKS